MGGIVTLKVVDRQIERLRAELMVVRKLRRHLSVDLDACSRARSGEATPTAAAVTVLDKLDSWAGILEGQLEELLSARLVPSPPAGSGRGSRCPRAFRVVPSTGAGTWGRGPGNGNR